MTRTGIRIPQVGDRVGPAETVELFTPYSLDSKSPVFEVRSEAVLLTAYGLQVDESIIVNSVYGPANALIEQPFLLDGAAVVLSGGLTSVLLPTSGRYRLQFIGQLQQSMSCTLTVQKSKKTRIPQPSGIQANRPNLFFDGETTTDTSPIIEIDSYAWLFTAYGLETNETITVFVTYGHGSTYREEPYLLKGEPAYLTKNRSSLVVNETGRYRFKLNDTASPLGVVLVGNPTGYVAKIGSAPPPPIPARWGGIEGDIDEQLDLKAKLGEKVDSSALGSAAFVSTNTFATAAQGNKADTAIQAGDNVSQLINDAAYIDSAGARAAVVRQTIANGVTDTAPSENAVYDALQLKIALAEKGIALGVAPLGGDGKINITFLPSSVIGQVSYQGTWAANTGNPPTLTPEKGWYFIVTVAGSTNLSGVTDWEVGDWAIYNGTAWNKIDNTDAISSWNGRTGAIIPQAGDYNAAQVGADASGSAAAAQAFAVQRSNHTGTQLASTISDFAATVRATLLTGLSTAINTAVTAADTILSALGKLQAQATALTSSLASKADDASVVHLTGNETVTGVKAFLAGIVVGPATSGVAALRIAIERSWVFRQRGTGASAQLELLDENGAKTFVMTSASAPGKEILFNPTLGIIAINGAAVWTTDTFDPNTKLDSIQYPVGNNTDFIYTASQANLPIGKTLATPRIYGIDASLLPVGGYYYAVNYASSGNITLTAVAGTTLRLIGTATTGNRTVGPYGKARIWIRSSTEAWVDGPGVS